jgi:hypothetical protein
MEICELSLQPMGRCEKAEIRSGSGKRIARQQQSTAAGCVLDCESRSLALAFVNTGGNEASKFIECVERDSGGGCCERALSLAAARS